MKPLITSVSPSGHRISTPQPNPGFFRATKVGRCSDIRRICACADTVQASYPATIRNSPCTTLGRPPVSPGFTGSRTPVDRRQRVWSPALAFVNWDAGGRCYSKLPVPRLSRGQRPRIANPRGRFIWCQPRRASAFPVHALNAYQPRLDPGIRLLQFLVVTSIERIQTTSPVWFLRLEWDRPGFEKSGGPRQPLAMALPSQQKP
jgi:hypothetical protein